MAVLDLINDQFANDVALQARASNQAFISTSSGSLAIHARCAQVLDKRVAEYDLEEVRSASAIDPVSQSYMLAKTSLENGAVQISTSQLIDLFKSAAAK